ncbi:MAG: glycosyltransferase family 39 protein [Gemmatimonadaceae bacterium]|nr:glycosyltransferase family 39 protein [Gemmatimonadaceae bacterium]
MTPAEPHDQRLAVRIVAIATALRFVVAALLPLGIDESYAVVVSRRLSLSWFDHPPAVFWIAHAAATLGGESPIALRWPFVLLFALTSWMLFLLTSRLFSARAGVWAVVAAQLIPVFSLSAGSWVLPDGPLLCASIAAALALSHAVPVAADDDASTLQASRWWPWLALGLALGGAGLSKYHAALLGAGVAMFMLSDLTARRWTTRPQPYVALLLAIVCVIPVFVWNAQHDWISFRFQTGRAAGHGNPVTALVQNLAGQAGYLLPWFWVPMIVLLARGLRTGPRDRATWFCCCLGALPIVVFTLASLGGRAGLPHWPAPGFFMLLPMLGAAIARWEGRTADVVRQRMRLAGIVYVALLTIVVSHAATGWVARIVPSLRRADPAFELLEYRSLRDTLNARGLLAPSTFVATTDWLRGSKIGYALGPERPVLVFNADARHFPFTADMQSLQGNNGLMLMRIARNESEVEMWIAAQDYVTMFDTLHFEGTVPVLRGADTAVTLGVFRAVHLSGTFHGSPVK